MAATLLTPADFERLARARGERMADVLRRAGVETTVFGRWKAARYEPSLRNYRRMRDAVLGTTDGSIPEALAAALKPDEERDDDEQAA